MNKRYIDFVPPKKDAVKIETPRSGAKSISVADGDELGVVRVTSTRKAAEGGAGTGVRTGVRAGGRTMDSFTAKRPARRVEPAPVKRAEVAPVRRAETAPVRRAKPAPLKQTREEVTYGEVSSRRTSDEAAPAFGVIEDLSPRFVKTEVPKRPLSNGKSREMAALEEFSDADADNSSVNAKKAPLRAHFMASRKPRAAGAREMARRPVDRLADRPEGNWDDEPAPQITKKVIDWPKGKSVEGYYDEEPMNLPVSNNGEKPEQDEVDKLLDEALFEAENVGKRGKKTGRILRPTPFVNTEKVEKRPLSKVANVKKVVVPEEEPSGPVTIIHKPERDSKMGLVAAIVITIILGATAGTVAFLLLPK